MNEYPNKFAQFTIDVVDGLIYLETTKKVY